MSHTQHLLWELCADSPAPRHRLFLAAVTVHYSHENKISLCFVLPWDTAPGVEAARDSGLSPLTMHCLWSWVTSKATRGTGAPPPVVLRKAQGRDQPGLEGCEVGTGIWDQAAFPGVPGMGMFICALSPCFANCRTHLQKSACWSKMPSISLFHSIFLMVTWLGNQQNLLKIGLPHPSNKWVLAV